MLLLYSIRKADTPKSFSKVSILSLLYKGNKNPLSRIPKANTIPY